MQSITSRPPQKDLLTEVLGEFIVQLHEIKIAEQTTT